MIKYFIYNCKIIFYVFNLISIDESPRIFYHINFAGEFSSDTDVKQLYSKQGIFM